MNMDEEEANNIEELITNHKRRLAILKNKAAMHGRNCPPEISIEIEDIETELQKLYRRKAQLQKSGPNDERCPYLGLDSFQEEDAEFFFGRIELVEKLVQRAGAVPFLCVLGPSGSGKSSLVRAGLIPALKRGELPGSQDWRYAIFKPGDRPLNALAGALVELQKKQFIDQARKASIDLSGATNSFPLVLDPDMAGRLANDDKYLLNFVETYLNGNQGRRVVLVVDQAEELWSLAPENAEERRKWIEQKQQPFIRSLCHAVRESGSPILVVLTLRSDFLELAARRNDLVHLINSNNEIVGPLQDQDLREVIERPAEKVGYTFAEGLVNDLVKQTLEAEYTLPLLELSLTELWKAAKANSKRVIDTTKIYQPFISIEKTLEKKAEEVLTGYKARAQDKQLRDVMLRLVQLGDGANDTGRQVLLKDLADLINKDLPATLAFLSPMIDERLLTAGQNSVTKEETIELAHEILIKAWPTLSDWIKENRDDIRRLKQIEEAAKEWESKGKHPGYLWSDLRLENAVAWRSSGRLRMGQREKLFLEMSITKAKKDRRARVILQSLTAMVALLLIIAVVVAFIVNQSREREASLRAQAEKSAQEADQARTQAAQALFELNRRSGQSLLLVRSSVLSDTNSYSPLVSRAIFQTFDESLLNTVLEGHTSAIHGVAWNPEGTQLATGGCDGEIRIWDVKTSHTLSTFSLNESVQPPSNAAFPCLINALAWSPDGKLLAYGGDDQFVRIWSLATHRDTLIPPLGHDRPVQSITWSPDSRYIATGSGDWNWFATIKSDPAYQKNAAIKIWDISNNSVRILSSIGHQGAVWAVDWSGDGAFLLSAGGDGTADIWDAATGNEVRSFKQPKSIPSAGGNSGWSCGGEPCSSSSQPNDILAAAWSPDGKRFVSGDNAGVARIWDINQDQPIATMVGHRLGIWSIDWSPDGEHIATGSDDLTARIWDAQTGEAHWTLSGHRNVMFVQWSPSGNQLATASRDSTARIWEVPHPARQFANHTGAINTVAWKADGSQIATTGSDRVVRIQEVNSGKIVRFFDRHPEQIVSMSWNHKDNLILSASRDGAILLWDPANGGIVHSIKAPEKITVAARSEDGVLVAAGGFNAIVRIWDINTGRIVQTIDVRKGLLETSDGSTLLQRPTWDGSDIIVESMAWDSTGRRLLIGLAVSAINAHQSGIAQIWDIATGQQLQTFTGEGKEVPAVAWKPDGKQVATTNFGPQAYVWDVETGALVSQLIGHSKDVNTAAWSPDGSLLLTSSWDGTSRIWDATTGMEVRVLSANIADIQNSSGPAAAWSPDGRFILAGGKDGVARIWLADRHIIVAELTRRLCNLAAFSDSEIKKKISGWRGCATELAAIQKDLATYDDLYREFGVN